MRASQEAVIPVMLRNGSNNDFYLMAKHLANIFDLSGFDCLEENMEQYTSFSVSLEKKSKY